MTVLLPKPHIDVLMNGAIHYNLARPNQLCTQVGQRLWTANSRAVNWSIGQRRKHPTYELELAKHEVHPMAVVSAMACLEWQCGSHPNWEKTSAYTWLRLLGGVLTLEHPELKKDHAGEFLLPEYGIFPWIFQSLEQAYGPAKPGTYDATEAMEGLLSEGVDRE